jgi:hypothetical protein
MIYTQDQWNVGHFAQDGNPMIVRARTTLPTKADRERYANLIIIKWPYTQGQAGMPDASEKERMAEFEEALESGIEAKEIGVHALSLTGRGVREWRYYTDDPQKFMEALHQDLQEKIAFPIDLQLVRDPEWEALAEYVGSQI